LVIYLKLHIAAGLVSILLLSGLCKDQGIMSNLGGIGDLFDEVVSCRNVVWDFGDGVVRVEEVVA
jgi:hypothetical protein